MYNKEVVIHLSIQDYREKKDKNTEYNHFLFGYTANRNAHQM